MADAQLSYRASRAVSWLREYLANERSLDADELDTLRVLVREECRGPDGLYFFAQEVLGFDKLTSETHRRWAADLVRVSGEARKIAKLKPRGTYKTTLYGVAWVLYLWAVVSPLIRIFYTSANELLLNEVADALDRHVGAPGQKPESLYALVFGVTRERRTKNDQSTYNVTGRGKDKGFSLVMRTSGAGTAGVHPHVIIVDDPSDQSDRISPAIRLSKRAWFDTLSALLVPLDVDGRTWKHVFLIGTRWHMEDVVSYALRAPGWNAEVESIYADDGVSPRYPEFLDAGAIQQLRADTPDDVFWSCQYLNNPLDPSQITFDRARIQRYEWVGFRIDQGANYCLLDPAKGKQSKNADYPATIWVHARDGVLYVFDAIDAKMPLDRLLAEVAVRNKRYAVRKMIFEDTGATLIEETIRREHATVGWTLEIQGVRHSTNKEERIRSMQPIMHSGGVRFRADAEQVYPELWNQLIFWPVYGHDDFPDVIEMACAELRRPAFKAAGIGGGKVYS